MIEIRELSFVSQEPLTTLPFISYRIRLNQPVEPSNLASELGKLANQLKYQYRVPILSNPSQVTLLSPISLPPQTEAYTVLEQENINLADKIYQRFLLQVCNFALYRAFENAKNRPRIDRYAKRIYSVQKPTDISSFDKSEPIEAQRYLTFDFLIDQAQHLVLVLDFANEYHSRLTIDQLGFNTLSIGQRLIHTYDGKSCEFIGIGEGTINTPIAELGNKSLIEYHQDKQNLTSQQIKNLDLSTSVIKVLYNSNNGKPFEAYHIPQLLRKIYDSSAVDRLRFNQQILAINEKVELAQKTIEFINKKFNLANNLIIKFSDSLRKPDNLQYFLNSEQKVNLNFGQQSFPYSTTGLKKGFLLEKPEEIKAFILYPQNLKDQAGHYIQSLRQELDRFKIKLLRNLQEYNPKNALEINQICQSLPACDCVIAFVPESEEADYDPDVNPYKRIKNQLLKNHIPSQMINYSTLNKGWDTYVGYNLILGINAKLGYLSWKLNHIPGKAQAFIGLDIGRKNNRSVGASAFVLNNQGQLIGWENTELRSNQETLDTESIRNLILDLCTLYQTKYKSPLQHLVIHRDGELRQSEYQVLLDIQTILKRAGLENLDVVEVLKSGTCRAVAITENGDYIKPEKGYAWEHCENEAIILTTGGHETKVSPKSSPRPLRIRKRLGETDILTLAAQVYWLSEMQVGSTQTIRLPITTYYADKAAEAALDGILPLGLQQNKCLWFL